MYRISVDLDLSDIVGSDLNQICLGRYDVQFVFGSKTTIAVQSRACFLDKEKVVAVWNDADNWSSLSFQRFLNATVQSYSVMNDRTLEIQFSGDLRLQLHDDSDQYESMQIYRKGEANGPIVI